jgi:putative oxidoreductase
MKKILSIHYSSGAFNFSMLLLRLSFGLLMLLKHGMDMLMNFSTLQAKFYNFMGIGSRFSLILAIFAEVFCSLFIILGLFTRLACIPLIIFLCVAIFSYYKNSPWGEMELSIIYLTAFITLLFCGPGKISVDGMMR